MASADKDQIKIAHMLEAMSAKFVSDITTACNNFAKLDVTESQKKNAYTMKEICKKYIKAANPPSNDAQADMKRIRTLLKIIYASIEVNCE